MRISESGCDVESEVIAVLYDILSQSHVLHCTLFERLSKEEWLQQWVQFLSHILQKYWRPKLNAVLQCAGIVRVRELYDRQLVGPLQILDPLVGLAYDGKHVSTEITLVNILACGCRYLRLKI